MSNGRPSLCDGLVGEYSLGLHVGAILVVLFSSLLGTGLPILARFLPFLRTNSFFFVLCKTAATGVLLSVSAIHLINDAVNDFHEPCISAAFTNFYSGYALLFAFTSALLMHAVDLQLASITESWMRQRHENDQRVLRTQLANQDAPMELKCVGPSGKGDAGAIQPAAGAVGDADSRPTSLGAVGCSVGETLLSGRDGAFPSPPPQRSASQLTQIAHRTQSSHLHRRHISVNSSFANSRRELWSPTEEEPVVEDANSPSLPPPPPSASIQLDKNREHAEEQLRQSTVSRATEYLHDGHHPADDDLLLPSAVAHGHSHGVVLPPPNMPQLRRVIAAVCMEFGVSLHSIFVGLDVGLTTDHDLKPLLIAIVFHQLFEGVSLGARLVDAEFRTALEVTLAVVFAVSAPLGMAAATIAIAVRKDAMSGGGFVLMMAVLSSFCGGILLYLAFNLLFTDFATDLQAFGGPAHPCRRLAMFLALWAGFLIMAAVGKWL